MCIFTCVSKYINFALVLTGLECKNKSYADPQPARATRLVQASLSGEAELFYRCRTGYTDNTQNGKFYETHECTCDNYTEHKTTTLTCTGRLEENTGIDHNQSTAICIKHLLSSL